MSCLPLGVVTPSYCHRHYCRRVLVVPTLFCRCRDAVSQSSRQHPLVVPLSRFCPVVVSFFARWCPVFLPASSRRRLVIFTSLSRCSPVVVSSPCCRRAAVLLMLRFSRDVVVLLSLPRHIVQSLFCCRPVLPPLSRCRHIVVPLSSLLQSRCCLVLVALCSCISDNVVAFPVR